MNDSNCQQPARDRFFQGVAWLGGSEALHRVSRILTAVILARHLDAAAFGWAALALTVFELTRVLTNNGLSQSIIRASAEQLEAVSQHVHRLGWQICCALFLLQSGLALALAHWHQDANLGLMIAALSLVYFILPFGLVSVALILRDNNMPAIAKISATQMVLDNLLTAVLALAGAGAWAIVLPKLLTAPVWLLCVWRVHHWRPQACVNNVCQRELWRYCRPVLASEILNASRQHLDKLIIGACLGVEALGIYYFAYHAGVGFSLSLTGAFATAVFPHLAAAKTATELRKKLQQSLRASGLLICVLILLQALLSGWYVPVVFGESWAHATPLVALLCLSAVFKVLGDAASQTWRAVGTPQHDLQASLIFTVVYLLGLVMVSPWGLHWATAYIAVIACLFYPTYLAWTWLKLKQFPAQRAHSTVII